jgi:hypothetical protein
MMALGEAPKGSKPNTLNTTSPGSCSTGKVAPRRCTLPATQALVECSPATATRSSCSARRVWAA